MNYTLRQLQIFYEISKNESITQTAEELHLSQPAVSIQLKNFQQQFEFPLTETIGRKLYITDFGKEIAEAAERILLESENIDQRVKAYKGQLFGKLKISTVSTGKYIIPYYLSAFLRENPGVELELDVTNKARVIESVENNQTDFALMSVLPAKLPLEYIELLKNDLFLVGSATSVLDKNLYSNLILKKIPLIYREQGSGTRYTMEKYLDKNSIDIKPRLELTSNEAVKQAVIADLGLSIMPYIGIKNEIKLGLLKIIPVKGLPITTSWYFTHHKSKNLSPVARALKAYLTLHKEEIERTYFSA